METDTSNGFSTSEEDRFYLSEIGSSIGFYLAVSFPACAFSMSPSICLNMCSISKSLLLPERSRFLALVIPTTLRVRVSRALRAAS